MRNKCIVLLSIMIHAPVQSAQFTGEGGSASREAAVVAPAAPTTDVLDKAGKAEIVETMARAAEQRYIDAAGGAKIADKLRQRHSAGAYDEIVKADEMAKALSRDLLEAVPDVHLRAVYEPNRAERGQIQRMVPVGGSGPAPYARIDRRSDAEIAATNFGFGKVERLDGNVGYLKLTRLVPLALSQEVTSAAMAALQGSDAAIIDLRGVPGGSPDLVAQIVSHFAKAEPVRLMTTYNRSLDQTEELWTVPNIDGGRLAGVPLYILQDRKTASAAEMLSYVVQRHKLGTVVGETSAGAGNGGNMVPVGSNISFFLPQFRTVDGPGWEGTGVAPDVSTSGEEALNVAHAAARAEIQGRRRKT
ncbi:S41 family peptidase [Tsuneonella sp. SYSU-LHT278]|uniref:S41 family peptidase n=1 Tax=Tsuneonella sediminis TaxID=3416089 RepID=UPI003F7A1181